MAFVDPNALLALPNLGCLDKCPPPGSQWSVIIALIATWGGLSPDPQSLLAGTACIDKCIPPGMQLSVILVLLQKLAGN